MPEAAEIMVRESKSLKEAVTDIGIPLNTLECANIARRTGFQELLRKTRNKYHTEVGTDPGLTKDNLAGQMQLLVEQLKAEGNAKEALTGLERLAKVKGWVGEGGNINIFQGLTTRDIEEMKAKLGTNRDRSSASASKLN